MSINVSGIQTGIQAKQTGNNYTHNTSPAKTTVSFGMDPIAVGVIGGGVVIGSLTQFFHRMLERSRTMSVVVKHLDKSGFETAGNWIRNKYDKAIRPEKLFGRFAREKIIYAEAEHPVYNKKLIHRLARRLQRAGHLDAAHNITNQFAYPHLQYTNVHPKPDMPRTM